MGDGSTKHLRRGASLGYYFSLSTSVPRNKSFQAAAKAIPVQNLLLESDAPVLGPKKDERNEPANLVGTVEYLAALHGKSAKEIVELTTRNATAVFKRQVEPE